MYACQCLHVCGEQAARATENQLTSVETWLGKGKIGAENKGLELGAQSSFIVCIELTFTAERLVCHLISLLMALTRIRSDCQVWSMLITEPAPCACHPSLSNIPAWYLLRLDPWQLCLMYSNSATELPNDLVAQLVRA